MAEAGKDSGGGTVGRRGAVGFGGGVGDDGFSRCGDIPSRGRYRAPRGRGLGAAVLLLLVVPGLLRAQGSAREEGDPAEGPPDGAGLAFTRITSGPVATDAYSSPSASWRDVDGDGDEDLYVLNGFASLAEEPSPQPDALYLNDGTGEFVPAPEHPLVRDATFSGSSTWGDWDGDGDADVFVADQRGADNRLYRNDGGGSFTRVTEGPAVTDGGRSFSAVWVDIDVDGDLDLHVLNGRDGEGGEVDFVYRNEGGGRLERVRDLPFATEVLPSGGAAWGDYDADGDPDLFLPVYSGRPNLLYRNEGGWRFTEVTEEAGLGHDPLPSSPRTSVAHWVDWDADGDLDLFVGNTGGVIDFLYENDGEGRFRRVTAGRVGLDATYVSDALWEDLDNDADLDLVIAVWGSASEVYLNDGEGGLQPAAAGDLGEVVDFASSVSASDIEGDGDLDLYLTQWPINEAGGMPNELYRNDDADGNWIRVQLEGTASERSGIGARIFVTATVRGERRTQLRQVTARTSWRSTNGPTRHFGLGDATAVDRIEVLWPSGARDVLAGPLPVDRTLEIVEGEHPPDG